MNADIKGIIEEVVRERLSDARILAVDVKEDTDSEGEDVYRIFVVYDEAGGQPDALKTVGLARHTRSRLSEVGTSRFPIFSFISQGDAKRLRPAAA